MLRHADPVPKAAGLVRRLVSMAYETLVVTAVVVVASLPFLGMASEPLSGGMRHVLQVYWFVVLGVYFVACWSRGGRTLPMQTWKIRVVRNDGVSIGVGRAMLRYALAWLSLLPLGAGFLWAFFDREGQFLHDRLAGTRMIVDREAGDRRSRTERRERASSGL